MKRIFLAAALSFSIIMTPMTVWGAQLPQAADGVSAPAAGTEEAAKQPETAAGTAALSGVEKAAKKSETAAEFAAPAYGTGAAAVERAASGMDAEKVPEEWQEIARTLAAATDGHNVKVDNYSDVNALGLIYESEGSGVILAMDGNMVYIVTAAHCLKRQNTMVEFADGSRHEALVGYCNADRDVGFLLVPQSALAASTLAAISPAAGSGAEAAGVSAGDLLFAVSSAEGANAEVFAGMMDQYRVTYPNNPAQEVLQFYSGVGYGSSGGAVYSADGTWIGCISGGDTYGKCWAVPYEDILSELQTWLTELAARQGEEAA